MSSRPFVALDSVCETRTGTRDPGKAPSQEFWYVDIASVDNRAKRINGAKQLLGEQAPSRARRIIRTGDVIVSMTRPNLNAVALVPENFDNQICSTGFGVLRPKATLLSEYLFYFVTNPTFVSIASGAVSGAMYPAITESFLRSIRIPLPSLEEQRRIVDILNHAASIRRLREQAKANAKELIPALFLDMFGDPANNVKALPIGRLGGLIKVRSGEFLPAKRMAHDGLYPVYGGNGIAGYHSSYLIDHPVVVIGRVGALCGNVHLSEPCSWITDNALYVVERFTELDDAYLAAALRRANLNQYASQSGQPLISGQRIYPVPILVPPVSLQHTFAERIADIQATINQMDRAAAAAEQLQGALMARLLDGAGA